ncbi:MAG TPA: peptide chain release factor-like protein [Candidatus Omnitrophota bacterium]|nr:peptide chain release factor-like protein [Candidatus Omnitrophota bacterium]HPT38601.1 peptide chain release factor-like protein [Candidatus Omnitrophota bacterium]
MTVAVEKNLTLEKRMALLGVREEDIVENFIRSSGPGGQNVNKTSTCVYLKHLPTGLEVKCQRQRSQLLNRSLARHILLSKIEHRMQEGILQRQSLKAKIMRRNRQKPKSIKIKILEGKRRQAQKKLGRKKINEIEVA